MPTSKEVTDEFFEAVCVVTRSFVNDETISREQIAYLTAWAIFGMMDGIDGTCHLPAFDVTVDGVALAEGDYIHEAWGKYVNDKTND